MFINRMYMVDKGKVKSTSKNIIKKNKKVTKKKK